MGKNLPDLSVVCHLVTCSSSVALLQRAINNEQSVPEPNNMEMSPVVEKGIDEDGIRTHACRAQWISSPSP